MFYCNQAATVLRSRVERFTKSIKNRAFRVFIATYKIKGVLQGERLKIRSSTFYMRRSHAVFVNTEVLETEEKGRA